MSDLNFSLASGVKPMIRETANMNNDGGGGNLGYMQQQKKDKKERQYQLDQSIFGNKDAVDVFGSGKNIEFVDDEGTLLDFVGKILGKIVKYLGLNKKL